MKHLLIILIVLLLPVSARAATASTVYTGSLVVPAGSNITFTGAGSGCATINSSGVLVPAACPQGTAAFSAGTNITITGTNPYTINCPNCFTTTGGGSVSAATTFSNSVTLNGALSVNNAITISKNFALTLDGPTLNAALQPTLSSANGVTGDILGIYNGSSLLDAFDHSGNIGTAGQITATQFNISSKRAWKQDIQPLSVDAMEVLHHVCWSSYRYRPGHGNPTQTHIGFIADCAPSILSGSKHDHYDVEAVATVDAIAILQLQTQIKILYVCLLTLVLLTCGLGVIALAKRA